MIGAIIGNIIGSRFDSKHQPSRNFDLFTGNCTYTDATICTVAFADAILNARSYQDSLLDWCKRYPCPQGGYSSNMQKWLDSPKHLPYNSFGCGSAMRISPIGWLFNDYDKILDESRLSAEITHNHSEVIKGAQCIATLIYWLRTCRVTKEKIENAVKRNFGYRIDRLSDIYKIGSEGHIDDICQETVPYAISCFLESDSFEEAIRIAVAAGGNIDTKASIVGAISEAYYEIPEDMVKKACSYLPDDMVNIIEQSCSYISHELKD